MRSTILTFFFALTLAVWPLIARSQAPKSISPAPTQTPAVQSGVIPSAPVQTLPGALPGVNSAAGYQIIPAPTPPTLTAGQLQLFDLETKFAAATAEGGGKAFAQWFADDAVTLSNGKPAVLGRGAIAAQANWSPKEYTLTWTPQGAQMSASNDMGFTWGHYEGKSMSLDGKPSVVSGRYITIWKKQPSGEWKVAMDASAEEPAAPDCCSVRRPE